MPILALEKGSSLCWMRERRFSCQVKISMMIFMVRTAVGLETEFANAHLQKISIPLRIFSQLLIAKMSFIRLICRRSWGPISFPGAVIQPTLTYSFIVDIYFTFTDWEFYKGWFWEKKCFWRTFCMNFALLFQKVCLESLVLNAV